MTTSVLTLPDGRSLCWSEQGDPRGRPVLSLHGSPGGRLNRVPDPAAVRDAGIRQITYDRPGYGRSDPCRGRSVADAAADVAAVLNAAGVDRTAVSGGSGGGPHALAVAALLPGRCTRVLCSAGVAPWDAPDLDFFDGMDPANVERFQAASAGRRQALDLLGPQLDEGLARLATDPATALGTMNVPEHDRLLLIELGAHLLEAATDAATQGATGWADDMVAMTSPWGFDLTSIDVPVTVQYGLRDVNVPPGHGAWLARNVPGAHEIMDPDGGHLRSGREQVDRMAALAGD